MYKFVGISLGVAWILYSFSGAKAIIGIISIVVVLLTVIYFNQNKILYMPCKLFFKK